MYISIFDLFSIGIGPSSSHTVGPMKAAAEFASALSNQGVIEQATRITVSLYGSLALTGKGHRTDAAVLMGLEGADPRIIDPDIIPHRLEAIAKNKQLNLFAKKLISFDYKNDLLFYYQETLPFHTNGMRFCAYDGNGNLLLMEIFYSIGGGFIVNEKDICENQAGAESIPYPFETANELLVHCQNQHLSIAEIMLMNESMFRSEDDIKNGLLDIAHTMTQCIQKGCVTEGILPGGLSVKRRAPSLFQKLTNKGKPSPPSRCDELVECLCHGRERGKCSRRKNRYSAYQWCCRDYSSCIKLLSKFLYRIFP